MTRVLITVLLVAVQLPSVLAGQLVYHCSITGSSTLSSCGVCAERSDASDSAEADVPACCKAAPQRSASDADSDRLDAAGSCGCCDIEALRWLGQRPRVGSSDAEHGLAPMAVADEVVCPERPTIRRVARTASHSPPPQAPFFILHASLLV